MAADRTHAAERTRQAIAAAEDGDIADARTLLTEALTLDGEYEPAWLWFAAITESDSEKKFCLQQAAQIDPLGAAGPALTSLRDVRSTTPPELKKIIDPPPPSFISGYAEEMRAKRRKRILVRSLAVLIVLLLIGGISFVVVHTKGDPVYLAVVGGKNVPGPNDGQEMTDSAQWAVDNWNEANPDSEHELRLVKFYDNDDIETAKTVANQIVADGKFVGVVGHSLSSTSLAAGPIYAAA